MTTKAIRFFKRPSIERFLVFLMLGLLSVFGACYLVGPGWGFLYSIVLAFALYYDMFNSFFFLDSSDVEEEWEEEWQEEWEGEEYKKC